MLQNTARWRRPDKVCGWSHRVLYSAPVGEKGQTNVRGIELTNSKSYIKAGRTSWQ